MITSRFNLRGCTEQSVSPKPNSCSLKCDKSDHVPICNNANKGSLCILQQARKYIEFAHLSILQDQLITEELQCLLQNECFQTKTRPSTPRPE